MRRMIILSAALSLILSACGGNDKQDSSLEKSFAGKVAKPTSFPEVGLFNFEKNGKWGYWNEEKRIIIPPTFERAESFFEGRAAVTVDGKWGFINSSGKLVIPARYDWAMYFSEGLAPVKVGKKWGYIDRTGELIITPRFGLANDFSGGRAEVSLNGKPGYIDTSGNFTSR